MEISCPIALVQQLENKTQNSDHRLLTPTTTDPLAERDWTKVTFVIYRFRLGKENFLSGRCSVHFKLWSSTHVRNLHFLTLLPITPTLFLGTWTDYARSGLGPHWAQLFFSVLFVSKWIRMGTPPNCGKVPGGSGGWAAKWVTRVLLQQSEPPGHWAAPTRASPAEPEQSLSLSKLDRLCLEYSFDPWYTKKKKYVDRLEWVRRRVTKMIQSLESCHMRKGWELGVLILEGKT